METWLINKKHVKQLVKKTGKRWSAKAEETLNSAVMGIILRFRQGRVVLDG